MTALDDMLFDIEHALDGAVQPAFHNPATVSDLFEVWIFALILTAAREEGFDVALRDVDDNAVATLVFRTSPGWVHGIHPYCHAVLSHENMLDMELHHGVRVEGLSRKPHECDVALLDAGACIASRATQTDPYQSGLTLGVECKFYTTPLKLSLLREFIGLASELGRGSMWFATNTTHHALHPILRRHNLKWEDELEPGAAATERFRHAVRTVLDHLKG